MEMRGSVIAFLVMIGVAPVAATAQTHVSLMAGFTEYDLAGVNSGGFYAARVATALHPNLLIEGGVSYVATEQQFGDAALFIPELQAELQGTWGRFSPYLGLGAGLAVERPDEDTGVEGHTDFSPSIALGVRIAVNPQVGVRLEGRVNGIEPDFIGTVSALSAGFTIGL
jgi:hypothetical protein